MAKNNKKEVLILNALLTNPTVREASAACGVPESTIYLRLKDAGFKQKYSEAKAQMLKDSATFLQGKLREAGQVIAAIMNDDETPPMIRLQAARSIFDYCAKLTEITDITERLEVLEAQADKDNRS